jgi:hypothetical protein
MAYEMSANFRAEHNDQRITEPRNFKELPD